MGHQIDYEQLAAALLALGAKTGNSGLLPLGAKVGDGELGVAAEKVAAGSDVVWTSAVKGGVGVEKSATAEEKTRAASNKTRSWADDEELNNSSDASCQQSSSSSVSGGVGGVVSDVVKRTVVFGQGACATAGESAPSAEVVGGFYQCVVRSPNMKRLVGMLKDFGVSVPKSARSELAICTFAAGAMPDTVVEGQRKLRMLALVGDRAIHMHLAVAAYRQNGTVGGAQAVSNRQTNDKLFCDVMVRTKLVDCVVYPPGVDVSSAKTTATALEAVVGVLALHTSFEVVGGLLSKLGIVV